MSEMLWAKTFADTMRQAVKEPVFWAAVASVGLHGLIWGVAPLLPSSTEETEANIQRPVNLVELTPEEQSRIPEFELPSTALPPLVPSAPSAPFGSPNSFRLTPLPGQSSALPVPSFPGFESILPPPPPASPFPNFPVFPNFPIFSGRSSTPPPPPGAIARRPAPPRPVTPAPAPETSSPQLNKPTPEDKPATGSPPGETSQAGESPTPGPVTAASPGSEPAPTASPSPAASASRPLNREQLLASLPASERALYLPNAAGTGAQEVASAMGSWIEQARRWLGSIPEGKKEDDYIKTITLEQTTVGTACVLGLNGGASVGVLVKADGQVETDPAPVLLQSAGYEILNQEALLIARTFGFESPGHKRIYQMNIKFAPPENCPAAESSSPAS